MMAFGSTLLALLTRLTVVWFLAVLALNIAVVGRLTGGMKGHEVEQGTVAACLLLASAAAWMMRRYFSVWAAPFTGGVIGALACGMDSPYGGSLGTLAGLMIVLFPWTPMSFLNRRLRSKDEKTATDGL
jgi:hypothetical protein